MASDTPSAARTLAEARFDKARQTTEIAKAQIEQDLQAARAKTVRLKALRLAKEAADAKREQEKKPKPAKKAVRAKAERQTAKASKR